MSKKFYNALTREAPIQAVIEDIRCIDTSESRYALFAHIACESMAAAQAKDIAGYVSWYDDGVLYAGHEVPTWNHVAVGADPVIDYGINWGTAVFSNAADAERWQKQCDTRCDAVAYDAEGDTWSVHFHLYDK